MTQRLISLDIGSTYTKGALFSLPQRASKFILEKRVTLPTNIQQPVNTVTKLLAELGYQSNDPIYYSSSAKGGLSIVAIGIVPELTLYMAEITAYSAGGKIVKVFDFKLTRDDIALIDQLHPDIVLFAGGTDGGNEKYNLHNAKMLNNLKIDTTILYAGNRAIDDEILAVLSSKKVELAPNILPQIENPSPEGAREKIREIFLKRIIEFKGLDKVSKLVGRDPHPTPYSVFELVKNIPIYSKDWQNFCLVDMGGATTDFYSQHQEEQESGVVYKGIKEPNAKRTVEGDLGMRVSAEATFAAGKKFLQKKMTAEQLLHLQNYVTKINADTEHIPASSEEMEFDNILAQICFGLAAVRHAGKRKRIFTACGECFLQHGKNLLNVKKIIGSGGFLAHAQQFTFSPKIFQDFQAEAQDEVSLLPQDITYYADENYLIPLLANLVFDFPEEAVKSFEAGIYKK
jgi:uncharacterized protein (TIGR01319 family)